MKKSGEKCERDQEVFLWLGKGRMIHILPGESIPDKEPEVSEKLIIKRKEMVYLPVGAGTMGIQSAENWGGFFKMSCRLVSARRFVMAEEDALRKGERHEEILAQSLRPILYLQLKKKMQNGKKKLVEDETLDFWWNTRNAVEEALFQEGWELIAFQPGRIRYGGDPE